MAVESVKKQKQTEYAEMQNSDRNYTAARKNADAQQVTKAEKEAAASVLKVWQKHEAYPEKKGVCRSRSSGTKSAKL